MDNVKLVEGRNWTEEGTFECSVRLKQDELFYGRARRNEEGIEIRIPTGIPENDFSCVIHLNDNGETIMGRIIHGQFTRS